MKRVYLTVLILYLANSCQAQLGGVHVYDFLASPGSARATGLGGTLIMVSDGDVAQVQQNPALSNSLMDNKVSFNNIFHFAGINEGMLSYAFSIDSLKTHFHTALQYVSYGEFTQADPTGAISGTFRANEMALLLGASRQMNERIRLGANLKTLVANYASANGFGLGLDLGVTYLVPGKNWSLAAVAQNIGYSFNEFESVRRNLPFDLKVGYSYRLKHLPFRYTITGHHLYEWDIRYRDPNVTETDFTGQIIEENRYKAFADNLFRHFVFSGEFLFGRRGLFNLRFAYNHLRRQELKVSTFRSLGGFSLGFGMHVKRFQLDYGLGFYHLEGATNHLGVTMTLGDNWNN